MYPTWPLWQYDDELPFWGKSMRFPVIKSSLPSPGKNFNLQHRKNTYTAFQIPIFKDFEACGAEYDVIKNFFFKELWLELTLLKKNSERYCFGLTGPGGASDIG